MHRKLLLTFVCVLCLARCVYANPTLLAHYKLNENAADKVVADSSGNGHTGASVQNTDQIHRAGKISGAFDFTPNDYVGIADHDDFSPGNSTAGSGTPFSISVWVYMHNATYFVWAGKWQVASNQEWLLFTGTAKEIHFRVYDDSENAYIGRAYNTSLASYEGKWTHFVLTSDGGILSSGLGIYLNGNRVDDTNSESNPGSFVAVENLDQAVWIGRYDTKYTDGLIDNVMFFSSALTKGEVDILYNNNSGTENIADLDSKTSPRRSNNSKFPLRRRYE